MSGNIFLHLTTNMNIRNAILANQANQIKYFRNPNILIWLCSTYLYVFLHFNKFLFQKDL